MATSSIKRRCPTCGKVQTTVDALEVCRMLSQGLTMKQAAARLDVRPGQVREALESFRRERQCKTTYELMTIVASELRSK